MELDLAQKSVLVIDDDVAIQNLLVRQLNDIGLDDIEVSSRGDEAWGLICDKPYDLLVLDWKLPGLGGVTLFNRLRLRADYARTPILVVSGFVTRKDFTLLDDYPCTDFLEKPFSKLQTVQAVSELMESSQWYIKCELKVSRILKKYASNPRQMNLELDELIKENPQPLSICLMIARYLRKMENYHDAGEFAKKAMMYDRKSLAAMTEMAKILHLQGYLEGATKMLRMASQISMQNLDRLCLLGELELTSGKPDDARRAFAQALDLDEENQKAKKGLELSDRVQDFQESTQESIPHTLAGIANVVAIALAKRGKLKEALDTYQASLSFLTDRSEQAKIWFNMGVCCLKNGYPKKGMSMLEKSVKCGGDIFPRAGQVMDQIRLGVMAKDAVEYFDMSDEDLHSGVYDYERFGTNTDIMF